MLIGGGRDGTCESVRHVELVLWCMHTIVDLHGVCGAGTARLSRMHFAEERRVEGVDFGMSKCWLDARARQRRRGWAEAG